MLSLSLRTVVNMPESRRRKKKPKSRGRSRARPVAATTSISPLTGPRLDPQIRAAAASAPAITQAHVPSAIGKLVAATPGLDALIREDLGIPPNVWWKRAGGCTTPMFSWASDLC
jgi:hypothetical protein